MESWKKFQAVTLTKKVGLDVGRTVFHTLNRVEIVLSFLLLLIVESLQGLSMVFISVVVLVTVVVSILYLLASTLIFYQLFVQVWWLQPALDKRAIDIMHGNEPPSSTIHIIYVLLEVVKVLCLLALPYSHILTL